VERLEQREMLHGGAVEVPLPVAEGEATPMPDFELIDTNPTSPTYDAQQLATVSPRDYLQHATGWYFGTAL
jgi:hypothetical protein